MKKSSTPQRITLLSPINSFTGFGRHGIRIAQDVERISGAYVSIRPITQTELFGAKIPVEIQSRFVYSPQPEPWEILLHPSCFKPTPGKKTLYFSMHETTRLPVMGPGLLNMAEVVVVPCQMNAACFSAEGVNVPIRVVPLGFDTALYNYRAPRDQDLCVFGAAGRLMHGGVRKGLNQVIEMFLKAFPKSVKNVRLHVKCFADCDIRHVKDPRVVINQSWMDDAALANWMGGLTSFVSAARGEGFGLHQIESMGMGRPIITINYMGISDFYHDDLGYTVPHTLAPAEGAYKGLGVWAVPNEDAFIEQMRRIYNNPLEVMEKGVQSAKHVEKFSWDNSNRKLVEVLKEFGALK